MPDDVVVPTQRGQLFFVGGPPIGDPNAMVEIAPAGRMPAPGKHTTLIAGFDLPPQSRVRPAPGDPRLHHDARLVGDGEAPR